MEHRVLEIPLRSPVESLCWSGDTLIDWIGGIRVFGLDGTNSEGRMSWGYRFDATVQSPSGRYVVIYERLGTKGLLLDRGKLVREINRSFYHADVYEYPIVLFDLPDGRELIAHCPDEYNRIEIDEIATGRRLTESSDRKPDDFFHSRLAVSPDKRRLLSAGWVWHPVNEIAAWSISEAIADGRILDSSGTLSERIRAEVNCCTFIDDDRVLLSSSPGATHFDDEADAAFGPGKMGIFDLETRTFEHIAKTEETVGTMLWIGEGRVAGFYATPKVFDVSTGKVIYRWPYLVTGTQDSSIIHHLDKLPVIALDPAGRRFAVASSDRITVIQL